MPPRDPTVVPAVALAVAAGALRLRPIQGADIWWHMTAGRAVLEQGTRTIVDPVIISPPGPYTVNSWGFDVVAWQLWQLGGPSALLLLSALCATLTCLVVWRIAADALGPAGRWRALIVPALVMGVASARFFPRPQVMFLLLLALSMWTTRRALATRGRAQVGWAVATCVVVLLWAQVHLSVFIAPFVVAGSADRLPDRRLWPFAAAVLLLPFTGAEGIGLLDQVFGYTGGEASLAIHDTLPMQLQWLLPPDGPDLFLAEVILAVAIGGSLVQRRFPLLPILLVVLGALLTLKAHRFVCAAALLSAPWLAESLKTDGLRSADRWLAAAACAAGLAAGASGWTAGLGVERSVLPVDLARAADALQVRGDGFTDYDIGGYMGFARYGEARVYIDSRTITFHEDSRYFAQRAALRDLSAWRAVELGQDLDWAAVPRRSAACTAMQVDRGWGLAFVDADRALFVRGASGLPLDPCQGDRLLLEACRRGGSAVWRDAVTRMTRLVPEAGWANRFGVLVHASCGAPDSEAALRHLDAARGAEPGHRDLPWLGGQAGLAAGDPELAERWLATAQDDDARSRATRASLLLELGRPHDSRQAAEALIGELVDETPGALRATLAEACLQTGDPRCAAEQALRGALVGDRKCTEILQREDVRGALTEDEAAIAAGIQAPPN